MCTVSCIAFGARSLERSAVTGRRVLEVGSRDFNGTLRSVFGFYGPSEYVGVDLVRGPGVDVICAAEELVQRFGNESFDIVIATEVLEHIRDWRAAIANLKAVCRPEGRLLVTTRSRGFPVHGFPHDYWRYETDDFRTIFADCDILDLEHDPSTPGVFLNATKPHEFAAVDLSDLGLFSVVTNRRTLDLENRDLRTVSWLLRAAGWTAFSSARKVGKLVFPQY